MSAVDVSVIISTYNRSQHLKDALKSLAEQDVPASRFEIVIADNNSTDATKDVVIEFSKLLAPAVKYIKEKQQGLSYARNSGVIQAEGRIVAFLDDDATADKSWIKEIIRVYDNFPDAGVVGGRIKPVWIKEKPAWLTKNLEMCFGVLDLGNITKEITFPQTPFGGNFSVNRMMFIETGGFSGMLGRKGKRLLSSEEVLLCCHIQTRSKKIFYTPEAVVYHKILPERLHKKYLFRRAYWQGKSTAIIEMRIYRKQAISRYPDFINMKEILKSCVKHLLFRKWTLLTEDMFTLLFLIGKLGETQFGSRKKI